MTDIEKTQFAAGQLLQRIAMLAADCANAQVDVEVQKRRADGLQAQLDQLKPKEVAAAE
jgi:hypothetical protein